MPRPKGKGTGVNVLRVKHDQDAYISLLNGIHAHPETRQDLKHYMWDLLEGASEARKHMGDDKFDDASAIDRIDVAWWVAPIVKISQVTEGPLGKACNADPKARRFLVTMLLHCGWKCPLPEGFIEKRKAFFRFAKGCMSWETGGQR